jgi:predicted RNA-binding Zn ribbon-like protein
VIVKAGIAARAARRLLMAAQRPAPLFVGDDLALDFLNSVASPAGAEVEWLGDGGDLVAWLEAARAVPADVATRLGAQAGARALDAVAKDARALRDSLRAFVEKHAGAPLPRTALRELAPINELLAQDEAFRQIEVAPSGSEAPHALHWGRRRRWRTPKALLLPVAEAIGELVCHKDFALVRRCEGPACTLWFFDASKSHARRWCSMALCGNRAKAAAHRARARASA